MREKGLSRVYNLQTTTELPQQEVILSVTANKKQLIDLVTQDLISHKDKVSSRLTITASAPTPISIHLGTVIQRNDIQVLHDEADCSIIHHIIESKIPRVKVLADDTDIFVLLCHFVYHGDIDCQVVMGSPKQGRKLIDINATVQEHSSIMPDLLAAHGVSGCDTVAPCFGIGKTKVLKILRSGECPLTEVGLSKSSHTAVLQQASTFMLACYGQSKSQSMTEARHKVWKAKLSHNPVAPRLKSLPPTNEAFQENVMRAHLQVAAWRHAKYDRPPAMDHTQYGWMRDELLGQLMPRMVPKGTCLAPDELLRCIKCTCKSDTACRTKLCKCTTNQMACSVFCACEGGKFCHNERTREADRVPESSEEDMHISDEEL